MNWEAQVEIQVQEIAAALKHLPGEHDQDTHGNDNGASLPRLELKGDKKLTKAQTVRGAKKVAQDVAVFFGGKKSDAPDVVIRKREDMEPGFVAGIRDGDIVVTEEEWLERASSSDYGVHEFRQIAHETIHEVVSGEAMVKPGIAHTVEEGSAEILSVAYWQKRGQPYDERDAVRREGRFTEGDESLAATAVYQTEVAEVMRRAASRVGWDRSAIVGEVQRIMRGAHYDRIDWRDQSNPDLPPPTGVTNDGEGLLRWFLDVKQLGTF